jgi:hypothetical protein
MLKRTGGWFDIDIVGDDGHKACAAIKCMRQWSRSVREAMNFVDMGHCSHSTGLCTSVEKQKENKKPLPEVGTWEVALSKVFLCQRLRMTTCSCDLACKHQQSC